MWVKNIFQKIKNERKIGVYFNDDRIIFCSKSKCLFDKPAVVFAIIGKKEKYQGAGEYIQKIKSTRTKLLYPIIRDTISNYLAFSFLISYLRKHFFSFFSLIIDPTYVCAIPVFQSQPDAFIIKKILKNTKLVYRPLAFLRGINKHSGIILSINKTTTEFTIIKNFKIEGNYYFFDGIKNLINNIIIYMAKEGYKIDNGMAYQIIREGFKGEDTVIKFPNRNSIIPYIYKFEHNQFKRLSIQWIRKLIKFIENSLKESTDTESLPIFIVGELDNASYIQEVLCQHLTRKVILSQNSMKITAQGALLC